MSAFPFDAVIFDMDGVIVDTEYYYLGETAAFAKELGLNLTQEELNGQVGTSHQFFLHMLVDWFERAGKGHFTGEEALARWDEWAHKRPRDYQALINPGAVDTIRELPRRGVRVALASSSPMVSIEEVLNACGLSDAFEYVVSGEQFKESKPEPDIYLHALDLLGLPANRCCCVEDSVPGITAGKRAGLTVIAKREERFGFSQDAADKIIDQLPELLERAAEIPGVEWLRVLYCYPDEIDEELLNAMARHDNICKYLDLPLQHADPLLLKRMNRRGDPEKTRQLLHRAREMGFTLRTTFIVGFPGETDEQFAHLMGFVREIQFDRLGAFTYSPEEDTPAARMDGQLPEEIKQKRLDELMTAQQTFSLERNRLRIGTEEKVLVETVDGKGHGVGRSAQEAPDTDGVIKLTGVSEADLGQFVRARITDAEVYDLRAERIRED